MPELVEVSRDQHLFDDALYMNVRGKQVPHKSQTLGLVPLYSAQTPIMCVSLAQSRLLSPERRRNLPRLVVTDGVGTSVKPIEIVVQVADVLQIYDVLFASFKGLRRFDNVELSGSVVQLIDDLDAPRFIRTKRVLADCGEGLVDFHRVGVKTNVLRLLRHVDENFRLNNI